MNSAHKIISSIMANNGFRHKYQVAEYFGVSPQAISSWLTKGEIPSKHILKVQSEIEISNIPEPQKTSAEDSKIVIDYLINENIKLKKELAHMKLELSKSKINNEDELLSKLNSQSLVLRGRVSDGVITDIGGEWFSIMGYNRSDLVGHSYDEGFIHEEDVFIIKQNQANILKSSGLKESRFSTIRRWKHNNANTFVTLCMVWYVDIENDKVDIIAKPIDQTLQDNLFKN